MFFIKSCFLLIILFSTKAFSQEIILNQTNNNGSNTIGNINIFKGSKIEENSVDETCQIINTAILNVGSDFANIRGDYAEYFRNCEYYYSSIKIKGATSCKIVKDEDDNNQWLLQIVLTLTTDQELAQRVYYQYVNHVEECTKLPQTYLTKKYTDAFWNANLFFAHNYYIQISKMHRTIDNLYQVTLEIYK